MWIESDKDKKDVKRIIEYELRQIYELLEELKKSGVKDYEFSFTSSDRTIHVLAQIKE